MKTIVKGLLFLCLVLIVGSLLSAFIFKVFVWMRLISRIIKVLVIGTILVIASYYIGRLKGKK